MCDFRGYINRQHTIWCGICSNWEQVSEHRKSSAIKAFRGLGWKYTKACGYVCPDCLKQLARERKK